MTTTVRPHAYPPQLRLRGDSGPRRALDVVAAAAGLAVLAPLLVVLAIAVRLESRGPALYRQARVGRDGQPFQILKFRTMRIGADRAGALVSGDSDPRVTRLGRRLRATRLDELPQLVNLLRGELTLIGPRAEVSRFVVHYTHDERRLLGVRPGIIGPGAVLFAESQAGQLDGLADPEAYYVAHHLHPRLDLDLDYLAHRSLLRDVALLVAAARVMSGRTR
jgi:lipopolysaccharide/colanic/teichoic acid biosynthesis glycosyltransferase